MATISLHKIALNHRFFRFYSYINGFFKNKVLGIFEIFTDWKFIDFILDLLVLFYMTCHLDDIMILGL